MFPLAGPPPEKTRSSGCTTSVGKAKRKRGVKHKRGSCSKRNRHGVVKAQRPADSSVAGTSCGSSAAAAGAAAAAVASGAAAHHGDGARLGAPVAEKADANEAVAAATASSGAAARDGDSVRLMAPVAEQSVANEAADSALRRPSKRKRSGKHKRVKCPHTGQMDYAPAEEGAAVADTMDAFEDVEGANDVAACGAEVRAAASKESVEEASAAVVSSVVGASPVDAGSPAALHDSDSDTEVVLVEGRVGVADVNIGTTSAAIIRAAATCALQRPEGSVVLSISGFMDDAALRATKAGVLRVTPAMADPIFNTQSVEEMKRAQQSGEPFDNRRRQAVMNTRWASTALVRSSLARLCVLLSHVYGRRYVASEPMVLLTLPRAKPQRSHGDAADKKKLGNPPRMIGVVMAVEHGSHLTTWPGSCFQFVEPGDDQCAGRTCLAERVLVSVGGSIIFRGDMVHRGVENASLNVILCLFHAYLTLCDAPMASEHWRDETCPVKEVP